MQNKTFIFILLLLTTQITIFGQTSNMTLYSHVPGDAGQLFNDIWGYEDKNGDEYAIIGARNAIKIYKITDPRNPQLVYNKIDGTTSVWRDFKTYKNYVYGVADQGAEGLEFICMDSLAQGSFNQITTHFTRSHNIWIDTMHARLYAVGGDTYGVVIYDISNPGNPVFLNKFLNTYSHDIYVNDHIGIASNGNDGTYFYNFTNAMNPVLINQTTALTDYNHSAYPSPDGKYVYSALEYPVGIPLVVYEVNHPFPPKIVNRFRPTYGTYQPNNTPHNPFYHKDKLFVSYYHDGVVVFDIKDRAHPVIQAYYKTSLSTDYSNYAGCWGVYPYFRSGTVVGSDIQRGLFVLGLNTNITYDNDLILSDLDSKVVFEHFKGKAAISVSNTGVVLLDTSYTGLIRAGQRPSNADLKVMSNIVLRSANGAYWRLSLNGSTLSAVAYTLSPTASTHTGDIYFADTDRSILLKDNADNSFYRVRCVSGALNFFKTN